MTQVNGVPEEHRDRKQLQDSMQNPEISDEKEIVVFGDDIKDDSLENLPYLPINGTLDSDSESIMLDAVEVIAKAPPKKLKLISTEIKVDLPEKINIDFNSKRMSAADLVETYGGKFQKREVDGKKQEIVILKLGKDKFKFAVNDDGSLGDELIPISTFGKNKYISKSEHDRRMEQIFHGKMPEGIEVNYVYEYGIAYPIFTKDGKRLSSSDLKALMPETQEESVTVEENNIDNTEFESIRKHSLYTNSLENRVLNDYKGQNLITPEILELFNNGDSDLKYSDIIDEFGNIKPEFRLFDLNGDNKLDDKEKAFFSSGGKVLSKETVNLSIENFIQSILALDSFDINSDGENIPDSRLRHASGTMLYKMLQASYSLLEKIDYLPEDVQHKYSDALENVSLYSLNSKKSFGQYRPNGVGVNFNKTRSFDSIESVLLHELTHHILTNALNMNSGIIQEVETFYMQYKLYCANKKNNQRGISDDTLLKNSTIEEYAKYADSLKSKKPNISEKELALESFLKIYFEQYKSEYSENISKRNLKKQVKQANFLYLE